MSIKSLMKNMLHSAVNLVFTRINYSIQFKYQVYTKIQIDMNLSDKTGILITLVFFTEIFRHQNMKLVYVTYLRWYWRLLESNSFPGIYVGDRHDSFWHTWRKIEARFSSHISKLFQWTHCTKPIFHVSKIHSDWKSI